MLKILFINNINNSFVEIFNLGNFRHYEQLDKAAEKESVGYLWEILEYKLVNLLLRPGDNHVEIMNFAVSKFAYFDWSYFLSVTQHLDIVAYDSVIASGVVLGHSNYGLQAWDNVTKHNRHYTTYLFYHRPTINLCQVTHDCMLKGNLVKVVSQIYDLK